MWAVWSRGSLAASSAMGVHARTSFHGNVNRSGMTPITVWVTPSSRMVRPTMSGSAP